MLAAASGTVDSVNLGDGTVKIKHWNRRLMTQYTHMQNITVEAGDRVELLQPIGEIGAVGTVSPYSTTSICDTTARAAGCPGR